MEPLYQSAITQTRNLENSILLVFRESEEFLQFAKNFPQEAINIIADTLPKIGRLQYLILKLHDKPIIDFIEPDAVEIVQIMGKIKELINRFEDSNTFGYDVFDFELEHFRNQSVVLETIINEITDENINI